MSWKIVFVNDKDELLSVGNSCFGLDDAVSSLRSGDALSDFVAKHGPVTIKEIRLVPDKPWEWK